MNITLLCTDSNHPVVHKLHFWAEKMSCNGHNLSLVSRMSQLVGGDILFLVSCSQIIPDSERNKYKATLVLHASDLPNGRGWSPHVWSILEGATQITVSLIEAADPVDSGLIWLKTSFSLEGHELFDEINAKLFDAELSLMTEAVEQFLYIKPTQQFGHAGDYRRKRTIQDSRIDPNKSILAQFNLLRVVDPKRYPAYFDYQGRRYLLKIEKVENE